MSSVIVGILIATLVVGLTGIIIAVLLSIAGKEFYIDYQEYREYIEKEGDRFTSSLLYLSKAGKKLF